MCHFDTPCNTKLTVQLVTFKSLESDTMRPRWADIPDSTPVILYQDLEVVFSMCKPQQQLFHRLVSLNIVAIVAIMMHL